MKNHVSNVRIEAKKSADKNPMLAKTQIADLGKVTTLTLGQGNDSSEGVNGRRFV